MSVLVVEDNPVNQRVTAAMLGKLGCAAVRPPLVKLSAAEIERIRQALIAAGLLQADGRARRAA